MRMGDWIMFRGRQRFVIGVRSDGLALARVRASKYSSLYAYYSVGAREKGTVRVIKSSTVSTRARARRLLEASCPSWTTIVWDGDEPTYVHDVATFPKRKAA